MNKVNVLVGVGSFLCIGGFIASITCISLFGLNGCSKPNGPATPPITKPDNLEDNTVPFTKVEQTEGNYTRFTYLDLETKALNPLTPSKGNVNVLVVPVEFSDIAPFSESDYKMIDYGFNGFFKDNSNNYWESCKSFYQKSSNGALNFNFEITDKFVPEMSASMFGNLSVSSTGTETEKLIVDVYNRGLTKNGKSIDLNDKKYDINNDKFLDGIWFIYNSKNYNEVFEQTKFWAYTTSFGAYDEINQNKYQIMPGRYANCSILFMGDEKNYAKTDPINSDAHTIIHETGHMMGLDDYYDYGDSNNQNSYTGRLDMMDLNIGDHNSFSKYALGWTKAKVVNETTTLTLKPFQTSYDSLILPSSSFNGSAFGEYLIVEYYQPTNLNELDSNSRYKGKYPLMFDSNGLKIYHVDARLAMLNVELRNGRLYSSVGDYLPTDINEIPPYFENSSGTKASWAIVSHSNARLGSIKNVKTDAPLIELVSAQNEILYGRLTGRCANNGDLYRNKSDVFSASKQYRYFDNGNFNDGSPMNYQININEINNEGINLTITKE